MIRISDRRLWIALGALGAAMLMGWTAVLAQAPARATSPAAHRAALARQAVAEPAPATGSLTDQLTKPTVAAPSRSAVVPGNLAPAVQVAPPVPDRCSAVLGQGRPLPMCPPLAPRP